MEITWLNLAWKFVFDVSQKIRSKQKFKKNGC